MRRLPVLVAVVAVLVVVGVAAGSASTSPTPSPALVAARAAPPDAVSSDWYCTGGSGGSGLAPATIELDNVGPAAATGTLSVVNDQGQRATTAVSVPGRGQLSLVPSRVASGTWLAAEIDLDAGGVTATQLVHGPGGWAEAPCATSTSSRWYFAAGSTAPGDLLFVSVFNPTTATAVVDLTFATSHGETQPPPFQGIVLAPNTVVVAQVAAYVQNQPSVAAVVEARSGQVVASELAQHAVSGAAGLSLRLGAPAAEPTWYLPRSVDLAQGATSLVVFNPTAAPESVQVSVRLATGPLNPFTQQVAAFSTWTLVTGQQARIPTGTDFSVSVTSSGGPGVVVDRVATAPPGSGGPQWGTVQAVAGSSAAAQPSQWLVPNPGASAGAAAVVSGAAYYALTLENASDAPETVRVLALNPSGPSALPGLSGVRLGPRGFLVVTQSALQPVGQVPLLVQGTGPVATMSEAAPAGMPGVVAMGGIPLG